MWETKEALLLGTSYEWFYYISHVEHPIFWLKALPLHIYILLGHFEHVPTYDHFLHYFMVTNVHIYYNNLAFSWVYNLVLVIGIL